MLWNIRRGGTRKNGCEKKTFDASNIYKTICLASSIGKKRGLSVRELKKEYKMETKKD